MKFNCAKAFAATDTNHLRQNYLVKKLLANDFRHLFKRLRSHQIVQAHSHVLLPIKSSLSVVRAFAGRANGVVIFAGSSTHSLKDSTRLSVSVFLIVMKVLSPSDQTSSSEILGKVHSLFGKNSSKMPFSSNESSAKSATTTDNVILALASLVI